METYPLQTPEGQILIGIDEVGRGCLAGPVYAGAVVFLGPQDIQTYFDSKTLSEEKRKKISESIYLHHKASIGIASVEEIDQLNIRQATFLAMRRAVNQLQITKAHLLIDGRDVIPAFAPFSQEAIIKGDQKVRLISAASIVAKVARDEFMSQLALVEELKNYGFEKHKGYGTAYHRERICKEGPTVWHRKTFGGVKEYFK